MGKPVAGQLGQLGSPAQSQMQPQMPQQNLGGYGGGMGAFQDFMRQQQQASQMPQQPAYGGFGNGMGINIAQPPQGGIQAMPQQDMLNAQQQALAQMQPQMPQQQMPMSQMPPQNLIAMLQGMGNRLGSTGQPLGEEGFGPVASRPVSGLNRGVALPTPTPQQQQQQNQMPPPVNMDQLIKSGLADFKPQMPPQMPMRAPQQVRPEPPRMQAMRGIQQLANRQRGYNR